MHTLKSHRKFLALPMVLILLVWVGAATAGAPARGAGCKTEHFLITHLAEPLEAATGQAILPGSTGNKKAINLLAAGKLAFAYTCKPHDVLARKFKLDAATTAHWASIVIARDPIVVIANPATGVSNLTVAQLKAVFEGKIANWSEVGGHDLPVVISYLDESVESGVVTVFKETTLGKDGALDPAAKTLPGPTQVGYFTKSHPGAATFMALNTFKPEFGQVVAVDGVTPERELIARGAYPLSVTYHLVYDQTKGEAATALLNFIATAEGQALINEIMVAVPLAAGVIQ